MNPEFEILIYEYLEARNRLREAKEHYDSVSMSIYNWFKERNFEKYSDGDFYIKVNQDGSMWIGIEAEEKSR